MSSQKGKDFWGPRVWNGMHTISTYVTINKNNEYARLWWALTKLIPCELCQNNLVKKLEEYPPNKYGTQSETAFFHSYIIHDLANQHISHYNPKTPKVSPPFDKIRNYYFELSKKDVKSNIYNMIHTLSTTYQPENAGIFKMFIKDINKIIPGIINIKEFNDIYLRNNHDLFFWTYISRMNLPSSTNLDKNFNKLKFVYFNALGEECKDCKT